MCYKHNLTFFLFVLSSISPSSHSARTFWFTDPGNPPTLAWNGDPGDQMVTGTTGCVISVRNGNNQDRRFGIASGNFTANNPIPFVLSSTNTTETLSVSIEYDGVALENNNFTGNDIFPGGGDIPSTCFDTGAFEMTITNASLSSAEADTYTGQFRFCAVRGGNRNDKCDGTPLNNGAFGETIFIDLTVVINPLVLVEGLDDIDLGTYAPGVDPSNSDSFCIGTNAAAGATIIATSNSSGTGFNLTGANVGDEIPYAVTLTDSNGVENPINEGGIGLSLPQAQLDDLNCNGSTGGDVTMTVTASALTINSAADTAYSDTITLIITPN